MTIENTLSSVFDPHSMIVKSVEVWYQRKRLRKSQQLFCTTTLISLMKIRLSNFWDDLDNDMQPFQPKQ